MLAREGTLRMAGRLLAVIWGVTLLSPLQSLATATDNGIRARIEREKRVFSIEVRDAEVSDVLKALAQQSGFNLIIGEGVAGKVSMSFEEIGFKDALEIIIKANGLMYTVQNNVFWVGKKVDKSGDLAMEIHPLNYAEPANVIEQLKGTLSEHGSAYPDPRTNSVIIRDIPENIERARDLIRTVDVRTAQVVIEARVVEATSNFTRQLGIQWGGAYTSGRDIVTGSQLLPTSAGDRNFAVNLPAAAPTSGLGIVLGNISNKLLLDLELTAAENKGDLRIISRPRVSTLNNKPATIHSGLTFRVKLTQTVVGGAAPVTTTTGTLAGLEEIKTGIDLTVTPRIGPDGFILLDINTNKSDPDFTHTVDGIPGVSEKSAQTFVLIRDGDTVVIGGLYKSISSEQADSVPFLSRIPVLGSLFKSSSTNTQNEELLVFITPRIEKFDSKAEVRK